MVKQYRVTPVTRLFSWIVSASTKVGMGRSIVLTTTGRRSGEPRKVPVTPITQDGVQYIVAPYGHVGWVLNVRAHPTVTIERGRSVQEAALVEVTGQVPGLVKAYYDREPFPRAFMDVPGEKTVEDFASVAERFPVFRVTDSS